MARHNRFRRWVARQLDRLPGQCWADLWMWAERDTPRTTPWSPLSPGCIADVSAVGSCYCGKIRDDEATIGQLHDSLTPETPTLLTEYGLTVRRWDTPERGRDGQVGRG
jgi:hypothetical protein